MPWGTIIHEILHKRIRFREFFLFLTHIYATIFSTSTNFGGDFGGDFFGRFCLLYTFAEKSPFLIFCCLYFYGNLKTIYCCLHRNADD